MIRTPATPRRFALPLSLAFAATIGCIAAPLPAQSDEDLAGKDWPNYRGPHHSGISHETGWVKDWPEGGPPIAWRADIGTGYASMAVVGGRVYAMGSKDGRETVYCLDADSGEPIWTHRYPAELIDKMHRGGPSATPSVHNGRVYTLSKDGQTFCLDAGNGDVVWQAKLQEAAGLRQPPNWGFASSPVVVGELVVFQAGPMVALHRDTGEVAWRSEQYPSAYSTPTPFEWNGRTVLGALNSFGLSVVDAANGEELSRYPWEARFDTNSASPVVQGEQLFLTAGYGKGCALVKLKPGQAELIYRRGDNEGISSQLSTPVLYDGLIYGVDGDGGGGRSINRRAYVVCMDWASGEIQWRERGLGAATLIASDGHLIILSENGELVIAEATPEGLQPRSRAKVLDGKCWTAPVLSHGRIYARNAGGELVCVDVRGDR